MDDFERVKASPWEGVRNYEARNLMKEMKVGQDVCAPPRTRFLFLNTSFLSSALGIVLPFKLQEPR